MTRMINVLKVLHLCCFCLRIYCIFNIISAHIQSRDSETNLRAHSCISKCYSIWYGNKDWIHKNQLINKKQFYTIYMTEREKNVLSFKAILKLDMWFCMQQWNVTNLWYLVCSLHLVGHNFSSSWSMCGHSTEQGPDQSKALNRLNTDICWQRTWLCWVLGVLCSNHQIGLPLNQMANIRLRGSGVGRDNCLWLDRVRL